jgi:hypothetical protein
VLVLATGEPAEGVVDRVAVGIHFPILHAAQTSAGDRQTSYAKSRGSSFSGGKTARSKADTSRINSEEVKHTWIYTSTPRISPHAVMHN